MLHELRDEVDHVIRPRGKFPFMDDLRLREADGAIAPMQEIMAAQVLRQFGCVKRIL